MLDNVLLQHYFNRPELRPLLTASQSKEKAADAAMRALDLFRVDLVAARSAVLSLQQTLSEAAFLLSPVRILDILLWTQVEPRGGYRIGAA